MNLKLSLYAFIVLLAGLIIAGPTLQYPGFLQTSTHDGFISTGDHGRDLYAFSSILQGKKPYRDFSWVYGPLTPYYYGLMMHAMGVNLQAVYAGALILQLAGGILFFLLCSRLMSLPLSLVGSCWFLFFNQNFYHTYNNIAGTTIILAVLFCLFAYVHQGRRSYFYGAQILLVLLMLVKFNIGAAVVIAYYLSLVLGLVILKKNTVSQACARHGTGALCVLLTAGFCYGYFLYGLPLSLLQEYFPLFDKTHTRWQPIGENVVIFLKLYGGYFVSSKVSFLLAVLTLASAVKVGVDIYQRRDGDEQARSSGVNLVILGIFYIFLLHEFLLTGIFYRVFWSTPVTIIFFFTFLHLATQRLRTATRVALIGLLAVILATQLNDRYVQFDRIRADDKHFWDHPKAQIYVNNSPEWIAVVKASASFLERNLGPSESFLALPYEPMYYFLSAKESPVPRLVYYAYAAPKADEERRIIEALAHQRVDWVLFSNAAQREDENCGIFGVTHCVALKEYIDANYEPKARFGDLSKIGSWAGQHAVEFLKRRHSPEQL